MAIKHIEVIVKELQTKEDKRKFNVYKAVTKDGTLMDLKFRKEVKNLPEENSIIEVDTTKMNIQRNTKYPILWVQEVISITPTKDMKNTEQDQKVLDEMFE